MRSTKIWWGKPAWYPEKMVDGPGKQEMQHRSQSLSLFQFHSAWSIFMSLVDADQLFCMHWALHWALEMEGQVSYCLASRDLSSRQEMAVYIAVQGEPYLSRGTDAALANTRWNDSSIQGKFRESFLKEQDTSAEAQVRNEDAFHVSPRLLAALKFSNFMDKSKKSWKPGTSMSRRLVRGLGSYASQCRWEPSCIAEPQDGELPPSNPGFPQRQESTSTSDQGTETSLQTICRRRRQGNSLCNWGAWRRRKRKEKDGEALTRIPDTKQGAARGADKALMKGRKMFVFRRVRKRLHDIQTSIIKDYQRAERERAFYTERTTWENVGGKAFQEMISWIRLEQWNLIILAYHIIINITCWVPSVPRIQIS